MELHTVVFKLWVHWQRAGFSELKFCWHNIEAFSLFGDLFVTPLAGAVPTQDLFYGRCRAMPKPVYIFQLPLPYFKDFLSKGTLCMWSLQGNPSLWCPVFSQRLPFITHCLSNSFLREEHSTWARQPAGNREEAEVLMPAAPSTALPTRTRDCAAAPLFSRGLALMPQRVSWAIHP